MGSRLAVRRWTTGWRSIGVAGVAFAATLQAVPSAAQPDGTLRPPTVREESEPPIIRLYITVALVGALVIGANLIPSKRGHQD